MTRSPSPSSSSSSLCHRHAWQPLIGLLQVNLRHGVPVNESTVTSTAVATTHMLEFFMLSRLTQNSTYEVHTLCFMPILYRLCQPLSLARVECITQSSSRNMEASACQDKPAWQSYRYCHWQLDCHWCRHRWQCRFVLRVFIQGCCIVWR
jgi:hypothetical protein